MKRPEALELLSLGLTLPSPQANSVSVISHTWSWPEGKGDASHGVEDEDSQATPGWVPGTGGRAAAETVVAQCAQWLGRGGTELPPHSAGGSASLTPRHSPGRGGVVACPAPSYRLRLAEVKYLANGHTARSDGAKLQTQGTDGTAQGFSS